jgi:hypothetical protein
MVGTQTVYKGDDATILIIANDAEMTHTTLAISDFSITLDKGTVEQELVGETGNYFIAGSLTIDGSLTSCKVHSSAVGNIISDMIAGTTVTVSGTCGTESLNFYFVSAQVTGFDFSIGDADTITEGTIDFSLLKPYLVSGVGFNEAGNTFLSDQPLSKPYS